MVVHKRHGLSYDPASRQGSLNGSVQRQRNQQRKRGNHFNLSQNSEVSSSKVGRHRIPLDGITTALWGSHGRDLLAYLSELLRTFLFPTHPPGYVSLPLWSGIDEDSTLKWGLSRIVKKDSGFLHEQHRDRPHIFATTSCGCEAPAKWRLDGPLVLHAANV